VYVDGADCCAGTKLAGGTHGEVQSVAKRLLAYAAAACGGGSYQVLSSESHAGGLVADVLPGPVRRYSISFSCGPSDGRMPAFPFQGRTMADVMAAMPAPAQIVQTA
jgi:hypothetical protein